MEGKTCHPTPTRLQHSCQRVPCMHVHICVCECISKYVSVCLQLHRTDFALPCLSLSDSLEPIIDYKVQRE